MPHQTHQRKFGRTTDQRKAMMRNLTLSVLRYERVKTTEAKAKEVRRFVDHMIGLGKDGSIEARRRAMAWLPEPVIVEKVFDDLAKRFTDRDSGYVRTTRLPRRVGDNAPLMLIELMPGVDETKGEAASEERPRRRRLPFRRGAEQAEAGAEAKAPARKKTTAKATAPAKKTTTRRKTTKASSKED
jgi:large subunit ribosomal protein L17